MPDTADVPAIRRAHDILRTLAAQPGPVKAAELMRACNLPRSSLYLLLDSLGGAAGSSAARAATSSASS